MTTYTATYSPEDNKLRLYASSRLDEETYARVKAAGFIWAPKQELFVSPKWSPSREDLLIELAGEIEPEEMTLAERAQAKAERLDKLAHKKLRDSNAFQRAAEGISERFAGGQPILVGHHSERKARKDKERMDAAQQKAIDAHKAAGYWLYRAEGVERHANYKNSARVRANRIKTLLAELRDTQRDLNHAHLCLKLWARVTEDAVIVKAIGSYALPTGQLAPYGTYSDLSAGKITPQEARANAIASAEKAASSDYRRRYIEHTLNRLGYERDLLGPVPRFEGRLTPMQVQIFAREHGTYKPEAKKGDGDLIILESAVPLPMHMGDGCAVEMSSSEWADLMQSVGYEVPAKKDAGAPMLNCRAPAEGFRAKRFGKVETFRQVEMTKAEYAKIDTESRGCLLSLGGGFKFRTAPDPFHQGPRYMAQRVAVFLTDSKVHDIPTSNNEEAA